MNEEEKDNDLLSEVNQCSDSPESEVEANEDNFQYMGDLEEIMERINMNSDTSNSIRFLLQSFAPHIDLLNDEGKQHYYILRDRFLSSGSD